MPPPGFTDLFHVLLAALQISFVPARERVYRMKLPVVVKALSGPAPNFRDAGQIGERREPEQLRAGPNKAEAELMKSV